MNNTFDLQRFGKLMRKTVLEKPTQIIGLFFLNITIVFVLYAILRSIIGWNGTQNLTFIWGILFGGCYLSCTLFNYFSSNSNGSSYLTLPVSNTERWLTVILLTWVLYVALFILFFYTMDKVFVHFYHIRLNPHDPDYKFLREMVQPFDLTRGVAVKTYYMFYALTAAMFVGALYFNKISFIKTSILVCVVLVLAFGFNYLIAKMLFDNVSDAFPFSHVAFNLSQQAEATQTIESIRPRFDEASITVPGKMETLLNFFKNYMLAIIFSVTSFIRLTEKEF